MKEDTYYVTRSRWSERQCVRCVRRPHARSYNYLHVCWCCEGMEGLDNSLINVNGSQVWRVSAGHCGLWCLAED